MTEMFGFEAPDETARQRLYDLLMRLGELQAPSDEAGERPMEDL